MTQDETKDTLDTLQSLEGGQIKLKRFASNTFPIPTTNGQLIRELTAYVTDMENVEPEADEFEIRPYKRK